MKYLYLSISFHPWDQSYSHSLIIIKPGLTVSCKSQVPWCVLLKKIGMKVITMEVWQAIKCCCIIAFQCFLTCRETSHSSFVLTRINQWFKCYTCYLYTHAGLCQCFKFSFSKVAILRISLSQRRMEGQEMVSGYIISLLMVIIKNFIKNNTRWAQKMAMPGRG